MREAHLAPCDCHLFGPVDAILQMTTNWNEVFVMCSEVEAGNFMPVYSALLKVGETCAENDGAYVGN
jgi:hypothetical protein